jgi:tetratricopeptide (TPR) repeat protein
MQGKNATRIVVAVMTLIALTCVVAAAQQPKDLTRADVFAIFNGPPEPFEALMKNVDAALVDNPLNPYARFLHGVGLSRHSLEAIQRQDFKAATELWQQALGDLDTARDLAPDNEKIIGSRAALLISVSREMPKDIERPFLPSVSADFEKVLRTWDADGRRRSVHERGELLTGLAESLARTGKEEQARAYFDRILTDLPDSVYAKRARQWLDGSPESRQGSFFTCVGCHRQ